MVGLHVRSFNSETEYKFKNEVTIYSMNKSFCTKTELSDFKITLLLAKLDMVGSRLLSDHLIFSDDISVDIQSITFLLLSNIIELIIKAKSKKF